MASPAKNLMIKLKCKCEEKNKALKQLAELRQELASERKVAQDLRDQIAQAEEDKKMLEAKFRQKQEVGDILQQQLQIEQEERIKEVASLSNQLDSANAASTKLQEQLENEGKVAQYLRANKDHLHGVIAQAEEDKKALEAKLKQNKQASDILELRINQLQKKMQSEQEERIEETKIFDEKVASLLNQLDYANFTSMELQRELQTEKKAAQDFQDQIDHLKGDNAQEKEEKKTLIDELRQKMDAFDILQQCINHLQQKLQSEQEEKIKEIRISEEKIASLSNQLASANCTSTKIRQQLQSEKKAAQDLRAQIDHLQGVISQADEDKKTIVAKFRQTREAIDVLQQSVNQLQQKLHSEYEERIKETWKYEEEIASLSNQLTSATAASTELQQELQSEKKVAQDLRTQMDHLQGVIAKVEEDKKMFEAELRQKQEAADILQQKINQLNLVINDKETSIENLYLLLLRREGECKNVTSIYNQTKDDLAQASSVVEGIKVELELEKSKEKDLNTRLKSFVTERDECHKKIHFLHEEYNHLKSASAERETFDATLLSKKDSESSQLKEDFETTLNEANYRSLSAEFTRERDNSRTLLEKEADNVKNMSSKLQITQETLEASRPEAADLSKQLEQADRSNRELTSEILRIPIKQELIPKTDELKDVKEAHENLKEELLEVDKAETSARELQEDRMSVVILNKKLELSRKHTSKDKDARQKLERDMKDATKSLHAISKNTSLETEDVLPKSTSVEKNAEKELHVSLKDAHKFLTDLHEEMENLEKNSDGLQEELELHKSGIDVKLYFSIHEK